MAWPYSPALEATAERRELREVGALRDLDDARLAHDGVTRKSRLAEEGTCTTRQAASGTVEGNLEGGGGRTVDWLARLDRPRDRLVPDNLVTHPPKVALKEARTPCRSVGRAVVALAASSVRQEDAVALLHALDGAADRLDHTCTLVAENRRERRGDAAVLDKVVGVAAVGREESVSLCWWRQVGRLERRRGGERTGHRRRCAQGPRLVEGRRE